MLITRGPTFINQECRAIADICILPGSKDGTPNVYNEHTIGLTANDNIGFHIIIIIIIIIVIISTQWSTVFSQNGNNYLTPRRFF